MTPDDEMKRDIQAIKQAIFGWPPGQGGMANDIKTFRTECNDGLEKLKEENREEHRADRTAIRNLVFSILISGIAVVIAQVLTR